MAVFKCKMCGGDLNITEGSTIAECEYCGSVQTVPTADNEKKMTLFGRANRLRLANEFDKASGIYESIVAEFPEEAEAYWGLVLCKYGIEYVDDPGTGKKIPTCHRSSFDSVMDDANFEQACENADPTARRVYRDEAKVIEELRRGIIEISGREAPYDIFICYKETAPNGDRTLDSVLAQDVYDALTEKGYRVFFSRITLEDKLGQEYEPYIFAALHSAKIMLAFGTDFEYYNAVWVKNEWSRFLQLIAAGEKKTLIPCYKDLDPYDMPKEFAKLQAQDMGKVGATQDLLRGIDKIMGKGAAVVVNVPQGDSAANNLVMRGQFSLEDRDFDKAAEYFDRALDEAPMNGPAYLGKTLAGLHIATLEEMEELILFPESLKDFERAIQFAEPVDLPRLQATKDAIQRKWMLKTLWYALTQVTRVVKKQEAAKCAEEEQRKKEAARQEEENKKRAAEEQRQAEHFKKIEKYIERRYQTAVSLMEQGNYEEAAALFRCLKDFRDSRERWQSCKARFAEDIVWRAPVSQNGKWGYIDESGAMVIPPQFGYAGDFAANGLAWVKQNGKWGCIDESGVMVIPLQFDDAENFAANGLAWVKQNGKKGYIDETGAMVIPPQFDGAENFAANGLAFVKQNGEYGYIDETGAVLIPPQFDGAGSFAANGLAPVKQNGRWGYIDESGAMVIPPQFNDAEDFAANGLAPVKQYGRWGYIDESCAMVIPPRFDDVRPFAANGLALVKQNGEYSYIDKSGAFVIPSQFSYAGDFAANGLARVHQNGNFGYIDESGAFVIPPRFVYAGDFAANGFARVKQKGNWRYIDETGAEVIPIQFATAEDFSAIRKSAREKAAAKRKAALTAENAKLQKELSALKGIFSGKRRKEIEARLAEIERELKTQ